MYQILVTCPPMIGMIDSFTKDFEQANFAVTVPNFSQEMKESDLCDILGNFDGWIIGDDPASRKVISAGCSGRLKACMRWGVGTDNVDFDAFEEFNLPVENTPGVFGREVADLACHYVTGLARSTYQIDKSAKSGEWHKPIGQSLWAAKAVIVGFGDIGQNLAKRLRAHDMDVYFVDPNVSQLSAGQLAKKATWPHIMSHVDFVIFTAPLTRATHHMFNMKCLDYIKPGMGLVNVGRGPLVEEDALIEGLSRGVISSAALDVFELEPIAMETHSKLLEFSDRLILGSHNGSNTKEAVAAVSKMCIARLYEFLTGNKLSTCNAEELDAT